MKKKSIKILLWLLILTIIGTKNVYASDFTISAGSKNLTTGKSTTLTIKGNDAIGRFNISTSNSAVVSISENRVWIENNSYKITLSALKVGTATITVSASEVSNSNGNSVSLGSKQIKITVSLPREKSVNNNLKSLGIDGYELTPTFNKQTLEYNVEVPSSIEKINIKATAEDNYASITGIGELNVLDGINTFEIKVTSETGAEKVYLVVVNVVDLNPIKVTIDKKEYTVVKKVSALTGPSTYVANTTTINDITVPSFYSDITKYTLVGLKNSDNEIGLYIYNAKDNSYIKYNEINFNKIILFPMKLVDVPEKYKEFQIKINDILTTVYKLNKDSNYALIYGVNIETGKANLYMYDSKDNTLQRYNEEELNLYKKDSKEYMIISIIFGTVLLISLVGFIYIIRKNNQLKNKLLDNKKDKKENKPKEKELKKETEQKNDDFIDK